MSLTVLLLVACRSKESLRDLAADVHLWVGIHASGFLEAIEMLVRMTAFCAASIEHLSQCGIDARASLSSPSLQKETVQFYLDIYIEKVPPGSLERLQLERSSSLFFC